MLNETTSLILSHRSIRKFSSKGIPDEHLSIVISAAQAASTTSLMQAYTIIGVEDNKIKEKLAVYCGNQRHVETCAVFLVFCADLKRLHEASLLHNKDFQDQYLESFITVTVDTAMAGQNAILAAESLGLGSCFISGVRDNPEPLSQILQLPDKVYPVFGLCLGYPEDDPGKKIRLPIEVVYKKDQYTDKNDEVMIQKYDEEIRRIMKERTNGKLEKGWTQQMAERMEKGERTHLRKFLETKGFKFE